MPKNTACPTCRGEPWGVPRVTDPITDQEIAFAHLILSGTMNDRSAAEAAGLNPGTAAYNPPPGSSSRSQLPTRPPNRLAASRFPAWTATNPQ
jgi:hypothetical protein